jgi:hypothetical protein
MDDISIDTFINVENETAKFLKKVMNAKTFEELQKCCSVTERHYLFYVAQKLKKEFPTMTFNDICFAIIYAYYGLNLSESLDTLYTSDNTELMNNKKDVRTLFIRLTAPSSRQAEYGEIITTEGENISQQLRRFILGPEAPTPPQRRGGKKSTTKKPAKRPAKRPIKKTKKRRHHSKH